MTNGRQFLALKNWMILNLLICIMIIVRDLALNQLWSSKCKKVETMRRPIPWTAEANGGFTTGTLAVSTQPKLQRLT